MSAAHCGMCKYLGHRTCDRCGGVAIGPFAPPEDICGYCMTDDDYDRLDAYLLSVGAFDREGKLRSDFTQ